MLVRFNGCDLADESRYVITGITGWDDVPDLTDGTAARPRRHGSWPGGLSAPKRVVTVDLKIVGDRDGDDTTTAALKKLRQAFAVSDEERQLVVDLDYDLGVELINARVTALTLPIGRGYHRMRDCSVEFTATDPRKYSGAEYSASTGVATIGPGRPYPMSGTFQYSTTAGSPGAFDAVNSGNTDTPPRFSVRGPLNRPTISVSDRAGRRRTTFNLNLTSSEVLLVNPADGTVTVNGADRFGAARGALVEDLIMRPGLSTITLGGTGTGRLTTTWRDATL